MYVLPNFLTPGPGTVTPAMMATQTAGSVLLWDAFGNALAYAPVAAGRILTDSGAGLPPTYQQADVAFLIDSATVAAGGTYTSPSWTAGKYSRLKFKATATAGAVTHSITLVGLTGTYKGTDISSVAGAAVAAAAVGSWRGNLTTPSVFRGEIECATGTIRTFAANYTLTSVDVQAIVLGSNDDTTHDVTGLVMTPSGGGQSYTMKLWGYL